MILTQAVWSKVTITYDKMIEGPGRNKQDCKEETWTDARLFYKDEDGLTSLRIKKGDKDLFLIRAKVLEITPWSARFEAYWWSAKALGEDYERLERADVICEF